MKKLGTWLRAPFFTPAGFLVRAAALAALYGAATLLGLRDYATILAGSLPYEGAPPRLSTALGLGYVLLYFGWILLVPVFVLAAGLLAAWNRRVPGPGAWRGSSFVFSGRSGSGSGDAPHGAGDPS